MVGMVNSVIRKLVKSVVTLINIRVTSMDIVETMGGIPNYIAKILDGAAKRQQKRRGKPIKQQLDFMF